MKPNFSSNPSLMMKNSVILQSGIIAVAFMDNQYQHKVSIIVPLYNQERYLNACMRSIVKQTYTNLEIVVVNDGSTDRSPQILDDWAAKDSRIKVVTKQNEGLVNARRDGYREATGQFITFVDSDDLLPLDAIEILVRYMIEKDVDLVLGSSQRKFGLLKINKLTGTFPYNTVVTQPELFDKYFSGFFGEKCFYATIWARLFKKAVIDRALQETELFSTQIRFMGEDLYFNMKLFPYLNSMYRINDIVYYYRIGGGSVDRFNALYPELFVLSDIRLELLDKYNYSRSYDTLYIEYAGLVFHHAHQLMEFKKADKEGIKSLLKDEFENRTIAKRLCEFYQHKEIPNQQISLILDHDYEGMYNYVKRWVEERRSTLRYKVKKLFMKVINS